MFGKHGIISTDIIPAPVRARLKGEHLPWRTVCILQKYHVWKTWYNIDRYYTCASSRSTERRASSLANRVHCSARAIHPSEINLPWRNIKIKRTTQVQKGKAMTTIHFANIFSYYPYKHYEALFSKKEKQSLFLIRSCRVRKRQNAV